jgi:FlaA1/EpsC-like NDP-sugar epimerase
VLGRPPRPLDITDPVARLAGERVLITGAAGSIGTEVNRILTAAGGAVLATDIDELDVGSISSVKASFQPFRPTVVIHLAGAKHAPEGELDPLTVVAVNAVGTANMVAAAAAYGARIVTASTCKACDPETAYGASKLLAERLTLSAGGSVARFYNVVETSGNVFEIWAQVAPALPLPVTGCRRYFISLAEAVALIVNAALAPAGRYTIDPGRALDMAQVAAALYPGRAQLERPPRRGDRLAEPRIAASERLEPAAYGLERVLNPHDAVPGRDIAARAA